MSQKSESDFENYKRAVACQDLQELLNLFKYGDEPQRPRSPKSLLIGASVDISALVARSIGALGGAIKPLSDLSQDVIQLQTKPLYFLWKVRKKQQ